MDLCTTFHEHSLSHIWKTTCYYANTQTNIISWGWWEWLGAITLKQMKFSGVLDTNWEQFFIYLNFNCTIAWILTYLVLLYLKDQMITFRTQKYLNKLMHVVHPVLYQWHIYVLQPSSPVAITYTMTWLVTHIGPFHQLLMCTSYVFCHYSNGIK